MAEDSAEIVVIGGGAVGLSTAYHLAKEGVKDVLLVERNSLTSGTSWHAAGIVGPLRASMNLTKLAIYATELFASLEQETGQATGYRQIGGLWLARTDDRLRELKRIAAMGEMTGLDARILHREEVLATLPGCRTDDLAGALWVGEDGQVNPVDLCMAYAKGARAGGVRIREDCGVTAVEETGGRVAAVRLEDGSRIACRAVINCAGAWAHGLGARSGVAVPLQAVEHIYVVTEPIPDLVQPFPILRDLDGGTYIKEDAGKLVIGGFEHNAKLWHPASADPKASFLMFPEDWEQAEPFLSCALHRLPFLETVGLGHFMNGPESFTPDTKPAIGEAPNLKNYFTAAGFNSIGIVSSAGAGRAIAAWAMTGEAPMDLWEVDIQRFHPDDAASAFLAERVVESVKNQFDMHWPYKQAETGRDRRRGALHGRFAEAGAVFGAPTGWERPLWFAESAHERTLPYSFGPQAWWPIAEREAHRLMSDAVLFELSPFAKIDIAGGGALALLQQLCANRMDRPVGRATYSQMLNDRGGIEADVTVTRLGEDSFRVTSGAATWIKDLCYLTRVADRFADVTVRDRTADETVVGLMGPRSRAILSALSGDDFSNADFPFATSRTVGIAGLRVRATRLSFVGELGWELTVANEDAPALHDVLAGQGIGYAGHWCLDGCRLEKGFKHWGHDIGPDDTPLEAGLCFAVAWDKPGGFRGRDALMRQHDAGVDRRLIGFTVRDGAPLLLHDEPIYRDGELAGRTTSGNRGFRIGCPVCLGYVARRDGETRTEMLAGRYEIKVAGDLYPLEPLERPAYDPGGERMAGERPK